MFVGNTGIFKRGEMKRTAFRFVAMHVTMTVKLRDTCNRHGHNQQ